MFQTLGSVWVIWLQLNRLSKEQLNLKRMSSSATSRFCVSLLLGCCPDARLLSRQTESSSRRLTRSESRTGTLKRRSDSQVGGTWLEPGPDSSNTRAQHIWPDPSVITLEFDLLSWFSRVCLSSCTIFVLTVFYQVIDTTVCWDYTINHTTNHIQFIATP